MALFGSEKKRECNERLLHYLSILSLVICNERLLHYLSILSLVIYNKILNK